VVNPVDFFRVKIEETAGVVSKAHMRRAVDALCRFAGGSELDFDSFDDSFLGEFVAHLLFRGYSPKTVSDNIIKRLSSLYSKAVVAHLARRTDAFGRMLAKLDAFHAMYLGAGKDTFNKIQKIVRADYSRLTNKQLAKDLVLFAVYNGGMAFEQIAYFRKDEYKGDNEHILDIVNRYSRPRNKYLFPLGQIHSTPRQMTRLLEALFNTVLSDAGIKLSPKTTDTALDIWCMTAMTCGIAASEIAACAGPRIGSNVITAFAGPSAVDGQRAAEIRNRVIATLTDNPLRWYAMHFRRNVDYETVMARLKEKGIILADTYYPMEEILHKTGHKKVFESRPVISWLMFFRQRVTELDNMFMQIGDLAWGYRQTRDIKSPYAVISLREIKDYQTALGTFSADTDLFHEGDVQLNPGDRLVVIGGVLNGFPATFDRKVTPGNSKDGKTVYRIILDGGKYRDWVVNQDARMVKKITESHYNELSKLCREDK